MAQEQRLGWRQQLALKLHLMLCDGCTHFRKQLEYIRTMVKRYRDTDAQ